MRTCLLFLFLLLLTGSSLAGQSTVTGVRGLDFGVVIRGVQTTVSPNDPIKSGRFYVKHILNHQVQVRFTLPTQLARVAGGGNLPISFGTTDAVAKGTATSSVPVTFNPNTTQTFTLTTSADFFVNLGGRVSPAAGQATGKYSGTVVLTCTFF
jgi:endoglucanase Acf2